MSELEEQEEIKEDLEYRNFPVVLQTEGSSLLLYSRLNDKSQGEEGDDDDEPILKDFSIVTGPLEGLFQALRLSFQDIYVSDDELLIEIPQLGLVIGEDDVYSREVSLYDIIELYGMINDNTPLEDRSMVLTVELYSQTRFISRFNAISSMIKQGKGISAVEEFLRQSDDGESPSEAAFDTDSPREGAHTDSPVNGGGEEEKEGEEEEEPSSSSAAEEAVLDTESLANGGGGESPSKAVLDTQPAEQVTLVEEIDQESTNEPESPSYIPPATFTDGELSLLSTPRQDIVEEVVEEIVQEQQQETEAEKRSHESDKDDDDGDGDNDNPDAKRRRSQD